MGMTAPLLKTKLFVPPLRANAVTRPRLLTRLGTAEPGSVTIVSAPAGFGKTTLVSAWVAGLDRPVAWLSLDAGDGDPGRFLTYLVAALQTAIPGIGAGVLAVLGAPQPPPVEAVLTALVNELAAASGPLVLVLDDYHTVDNAAIDEAIAFLIAQMPPQLQLVIATREDPALPLARLRATGRLIELRAADLRFTALEATAFLRQAMGVDLSGDEVAVLETRTEGWAAGLQLAAISLQSQADKAQFFQSFTGSHRFVLDYLVEEVLQHQPPPVQEFLLRTSILERMCAPLCDAVVYGEGERPVMVGEGQAALDYLERANLFLVPLDDQRRWYRYHHLFGDLLRQRLRQETGKSKGTHRAADNHDDGDLGVYHLRASRWFEENGLELEAFQHAAAAGDIDRAQILAQGKGMPLHFRGAVAPVRAWLESLPPAELDARPALWVMYASVLIYVNRLASVEETLRRAEAGLAAAASSSDAQDLHGHIAAMRATVGVSQHDAEAIVVQAQQALRDLHPQNLPSRTAMTWALAYAHYLHGERAAAAAGYREVISISAQIGHFIMHIMATIGLAQVLEGDNQLDAAAATFARVLELAGDPPLGVACEAYHGLGRISYMRNDLVGAAAQARTAVELARQVEMTDRAVACELFEARVRLAAGDRDGAAALTAAAKEAVRRQQYDLRAGDVAAMEVLILLHQGDLAQAAALAQAHALPFSRARVCLAQGDAAGALAILAAQREEAVARGWPDVRLKAQVLEALAHQAAGDRKSALAVLQEALAAAEPHGFVRLFVDEGTAMGELLAALAARGIRREYVGRLLGALARERQEALPAQALPEPLSERELEVLQLIAAGLSNQEIGARLYLALDTVKGHNRRIFEKLQVQRRTEAVAKARALGVLPEGV
jgi:LuxR family maltose regulon positive regulatory protein